jgi:protein phosphatase 1E
VTAVPDVTAISLDGTEDFLVLACDGLWDFVTKQKALVAVYQQIIEAPGRDMPHVTCLENQTIYISHSSSKASRTP